MPCYNAERFLPAALDSVLAQSFRDWECVCTDDGSTDATGGILNDYATRDPRFRVIHQRNGGEGPARNAALDIITGEWFLFLDADDIMNPELLSGLSVNVHEHPSADLFVFKTVAFSESHNMVWPSYVDDSTEYDCRKTLPLPVVGMGVWLGAYSRRKYRHLRFGTLKIGADLVFVSKCMGYVDKAVVTSIVGVGYRIVSTSMSHMERSPSMVLDTIDFRKEVLDNLASTGKVLPVTYVRSALNQWFEATPSFFASRPMSGEWRTVWEHWLASLDSATVLPFLSIWQRFVVRTIRVTRSRLLVWLLCVFPHRLKCLGVHR